MTISERFHKLRDKYNKDSYSIGLEWEVENLIDDIKDNLQYIHNTKTSVVIGAVNKNYDTVITNTINQFNSYLDELSLMLIDIANQQY